MVSIDGFFLRKQYDKAIEAIHRLKKRVGQDPYLDHLHANMLIEQKQYADAKQIIAKVIAAEPDLQDAYWSSVTIYLGEKNFAKVAEQLQNLKAKFDAKITRESLTSEPLYNEFSQSPEGKSFLATL